MTDTVVTVDKGALADSTVDEVLSAVEDVDDPEYLEALEQAEVNGKNRSTLVEGLQKRRLALLDDEVEADALPEEATYDPAPVDEALPIIRSGSWARIKGTARGVPDNARGRDVAVMGAPIRTGGNDTISATNYEYQLPGDVFVVRLDDTGELFECTRAAFAAFDSDRGALHGLMV